MNILITTLGYSWQIVPELVGLTNPGQYAFYDDCSDVESLRSRYKIHPIDECWVVTVENSEEIIRKISSWCNAVGIKLRVIISSGVSDFQTESDILVMRSCIFKSIITAKRIIGSGGTLYLSLAGGRKTMSADMQEAGNLFGCDLMLHVIDLPAFQDVRNSFNASSLIIDLHYGDCFLPFVINNNLRGSLLVRSSGIFENPDYQLCFDDKGRSDAMYSPSLLERLSDIQEKAARLYENYSVQVSDDDSRRDAFYGLYFLSPETIQILKKTKLSEGYRSFITRLPKSDLHTHLGGVLAPEEIIKTALSEQICNDLFSSPFIVQVKHAINQRSKQDLMILKRKLFELKGKPGYFKVLIAFITCFQADVRLFSDLVYDFQDIRQVLGVGIEQYQQFGDFQGSGLLQSENTIRKAMQLYIANLQKDNIQYVELRCSPYNYTREGLTAKQVVSYISEELELSGIEYRLIFIIGRNASMDSMKRIVSEILTLYNDMPMLRTKLAGIDLAGTEGVTAPKEVREVFLPLLEKCMHITIHAGETEAVENIWQAVYYLSADRIGHGLCLSDNPELLNRFVDKHIGVELCPTSNLQVVGNFFGGYPLLRYMDAGLNVTINTDDMGISGTNETNEFFKASALVDGLTLWDCLVLIRNSLNVSFADALTKERLMKSFEQQIVKIIQEGIGS